MTFTSPASMTSTADSPKGSKNDSDRPLASRSAPAQHPDQDSQCCFEPAAEVRESDYSFSVCIDLPGISAQDIKLTSCTLSVTVQGQRRSPHTEGCVIDSNLAVGRFERTIQLPQPVLCEQIYAEYSQGVLRLELPKQLCALTPENLPATCQSMTL
ncbi:MAG: Hsp20/alpha crystallin family protein [Phormidesmis sp.]